MLKYLSVYVRIYTEPKELGLGLSKAHVVRCESIVKRIFSVFFAPLLSLAKMVGEP